MNDALLVMLLAFSAFYFWFIFRLRRGLERLSTTARVITESPFVSIVVAARNEETTIERCLNGLIRQEYPRNKFEIIVVDDGSYDKTAQIVRRFKGKGKVRLFRLEPEGRKKTGRKPDAITFGIHKSRGELIATTDADCDVPRTWLRSMVAQLSTSTAFLAGPVVEKPHPSLLGKLTSMEYLGLTTTAAGLIGLGRPINCSGANLVYRKTAFQSVNGFSQDSSCDDETLMQRIFQRGVGDIHFVASPDAIIETNSNHDVMGFLKQRTRWASKKNRYEDSSIIMEMVGLYFFFFFLLVGAVLSVFLPSLRIPVIVVFAVKVLVDYLSLSKGAKMLRQDLRFFHFLLAELFHVPYIVMVGAFAQFVSHNWKGRRLDR
ncbi:MAG: glycosyltransferase [Ignavibacteriales bacterium]|nr:glycosyltransferase [Ignavibacteriales bacterium]